MGVSFLHKLEGISMSAAAKSIYFFSFWVLFNGIALLLIPEFFLGLLGVSESAASVARIFGMVLLYLAFYYFMAGRQGQMTDFYRWTTYTRPTALMFAIIFFVTGQVSWLLIPFVMIDLLGALWTHLALKKDAGPT
jgi:hypothetical protein